jgi:preprotein translocase subunit SecF
MFFVTHKNTFFALIAFVSVLAVGAVVLWGIKFGVEFTGGTMLEFTYEDAQPEKVVLEENITSAGFSNFSLRSIGTGGYILRLRDVTEEEYVQLRDALSPEGVTFVENRRSTVGPVIGAELKNKALVAIAIVSLLIVLYVAFAFRNVRDEEDEKVHAHGVSSWTYGFVAIFVLVHDLLIPVGLLAVLGNFAGVEVDVLIVMAFLTILGYSVNDTIVIFDRVRENLLENKQTGTEESFSYTVGRALSESYARSINTSLTTLMVVVALLIFGGSTTMYFALLLASGVIAGTYSSVALAAPLLVALEERHQAKSRV